MKFDGYKCDECGAERRQANHWFMVERFPFYLHVITWDAPDYSKDVSEAKHLCGQGCVQKVLEQWMQGK